jgi:hypothetical protein
VLAEVTIPSEVFLNVGEGQMCVIFFSCISILILLFSDFFSMNSISTFLNI